MPIVGLYTYRDAEATSDPEDREYVRLVGYDTETGDWAPNTDARKVDRIPDALIQAASSGEDMIRVLTTVFDGRTHVVAFEDDVPGSVGTTAPPAEPESLSS